MQQKMAKLLSCLIPSKEKRRIFREKHTSISSTSIIVNEGSRNQAIVIYPDGREEKITYIPGLQIEFMGDDNIFKLYAPLPQFINCRIQMCNEAEFILHESKYTLNNLIVWRMRKGTKIEIGKNFSCVGVEIAMHGEENLQVTIGEECMFSHDIFIQPTDNHAIIDKTTKTPLNFGKSIQIEDHVWLCPHVHIHKGVSIPKDCIIGTCSVVTKSIDKPGSVAVGAPAKIIRENITWSRSSAADYVARGG